MTWSPDGRLLVVASPDFSGLVLFDVALGSAVRVGAGFSRLRLLRWSPDGAYLLAGELGDDAGDFRRVFPPRVMLCWSEGDGGGCLLADHLGKAIW